MEAHLSSDDMILIWTILFNAVLTSHLNHCLVCLSTRVLEEDFIHSNRRTNLFSKKCLRYCVWIIKGMHYILCLVDHGCDYLIVAASCGVNSNSGIEVEILFTILIIHVLILSSLTEKIHSLVSLDHILLYLILNILCG